MFVRCRIRTRELARETRLKLVAFDHSANLTNEYLIIFVSGTKNCNKIAVSLVAELIKTPHRKAGFLTYSQVRLFDSCRGNSFDDIQVRLAEWSKATSSSLVSLARSWDRIPHLTEFCQYNDRTTLN